MKFSSTMQSVLLPCCLIVLASSILLALGVMLAAMPNVIGRAAVTGAACSAAFLAHRGIPRWIAAGTGIAASLLVALLAIFLFPQAADGLGHALSAAVFAVVVSLALET